MEDGTQEITLREQLANLQKAKGKRKLVRKEQKRLASINLSEAGMNALTTIQKKTGRSRRDIVSEALTNQLNLVDNQTVLSFKFPEPQLLNSLRQEVVSLEAAAENIRKGLYSIRPTDKKQSEAVSKQIEEVQNWLEQVESLEREFQEKGRLLDGLSPEDYKDVSELLDWLPKRKRSVSETIVNPQERKKRLARYELIEKLVKLAL